MKSREQIQEEAVDTFCSSEGMGILHIAMRVGKTKIGIDIIKRLMQEGKVNKVLVAYPESPIYDSWVGDLKKWWDKGIYNITFTNYASLDKHVNTSYDLVIFDECHDTSEYQRKSMEELIDKTSYILGLTGTISSDTKKELRELGLEVLMVYSVEDAIKDGIIAPYRITIHTVKLDEIKKTVNKKGKWITEKQKYDNYTYVFKKLMAENKDFKHIVLHRNRILQSSLSKQKKTLELLKKYADKRVLVFTGLKKVSESLNIAFYHSTSDTEHLFNDFKKGKINHMAVINMGRSGVTFEELDCLIVNSFTGNEETTEQVLSRALNKDTDDKVADLHIICSTEEAEVKKLKKTLGNFNKEYIRWI